MGKIFVGKFLCASLVMLTCVSIFALHNESFGQQSQRSANERWAEIRRLTAEDHKRMMDLLGIKSLRPGRDGMNPKADNYANYDESKANPYPNLPDPLVLKNGQKVTTAQMWWDQRRPEIVEDFDREIYGRVPKDTPRVDWEVISTTNEKNGGVPVITKELVGHVDNSSCPSITVDIQLTLTTPANAAAPVPVIMEFGFGGRFGGAGPGGGLTWQQQVLAKGWGYAIIVPNSVQADYGAGLIQGIIGLCNKGQPRKADDWGALRAWAWGASRALDYFETDKSVDARQVGLEGHSRYGKATLVAMAYDQRFAIAFISSSGAGGASLFRRDYGEIVENLAGSGEYHWMAGNFLKYAGPLTWDDLPIDAHELVALCAPRPVFISSGSNNGDAWVDAKGMFLAAAGAGPVYKLLGKKDMGTNEFPPIETTLIDGDVAFRQHSGGHTPGPNWPTFLTFAQRYLKVNQTRYLDFFNSKGSFRLVQKNRLSTLYVDSQDYAGVVRAVRDLQADIKRVTGLTPKITHEQTDLGTNAVIVGTIGKSPIIDRLIRDHKIDVAQIAGKWESFLIEVVPEPLPGVASGLIIAGSDKRGTIYGVYDLSGQIGVSPWYWWADVPVKYNDTLFVKAGRYVQGPPAVKYRGIFLNDEEPALGRWAVEKYGGFNHELYEKVFELILRMKGNYLWPAMWWASFNSDDPLNPKLADEYGIVMGTTHHEPMMRAHAEWRKSKAGAWNYETNAEKLRQFWTEGIRRMGSYESIVTLAMRGDGDEAMSEETNIALLEKIVADQRKILADVTGKDVTTIPQLWALYKEVQDYYDKGMRVPEDVTLLLCDDNWGNVRRLPRPGDPPRSGGYGMYYHFDFVGGPRNYKWVNTNPIARVWEQMHLCYRHGVDRIWLVNVGDLKPMEFPIEFFLDYAWNPDQWPAESLPEYTRLWAEQQFGPEHAPAIAEILSKYTKYNSRRKPEMLDSDTYSLIHYREAETVVSDYNKLAEEAERINKAIPSEFKDAYYQLVLHPVTACANLNDLVVIVGNFLVICK